MTPEQAFWECIEDAKREWDRQSVEDDAGLPPGYREQRLIGALADILACYAAMQSQKAARAVGTVQSEPPGFQPTITVDASGKRCVD